MAIIAPITSLPATNITPILAPATTTAVVPTRSFADTMVDAMNSLNTQQNKAADLAKDFALGKTSDIHGVMIASEEATISFQMATQVRNKIIDAYQEVMRISM